MTHERMSIGLCNGCIRVVFDSYMSVKLDTNSDHMSVSVEAYGMARYSLLVVLQHHKQSEVFVRYVSSRDGNDVDCSMAPTTGAAQGVYPPSLWHDLMGT